MKVTILGAGAWGTALARLLSDGKNAVTLWGHDVAHLEDIRRSGRNERYLPAIELPRDLKLETDLEQAFDTGDFIVFAVPSKAFRKVASQLGDCQALLITVTKGIEHDSGFTMSQILKSYAPTNCISALSGPSLALEVARGVPTAVVAASDAAQHDFSAKAVQKLFHRPAFRVYTCDDLAGVELGGALKNVIAIAAGICDGLGFGDNSKAALVTRGLAEIRRLGVACGAQAETFSGLSGIGDLMVTCFSKLSRNRNLGERLGRGENIKAILEQSVSVAEGFPTARSAFDLARKKKIETPIIDEIYAALYESKPPAHALRDLTARHSKAED